jgi:hypothetical protein
VLIPIGRRRWTTKKPRPGGDRNGALAWGCDTGGATGPIICPVRRPGQITVWQFLRGSTKEAAN